MAIKHITTFNFLHVKKTVTYLRLNVKNEECVIILIQGSLQKGSATTGHISTADGTAVHIQDSTVDAAIPGTFCTKGLPNTVVFRISEIYT